MLLETLQVLFDCSTQTAKILAEYPEYLESWRYLKNLEPLPKGFSFTTEEIFYDGQKIFTIAEGKTSLVGQWSEGTPTFIEDILDGEYALVLCVPTGELIIDRCQQVKNPT